MTLGCSWCIFSENAQRCSSSVDLLQEVFLKNRTRTIKHGCSLSPPLVGHSCNASYHVHANEFQANEFHTGRSMGKDALVYGRNWSFPDTKV